LRAAPVAVHAGGGVMGQVSKRQVQAILRRTATAAELRSSQDPNFLHSREWLQMRYRVLKKCNWCQLCGHKGSPDNPIQVDHIKPRSTHRHLALVESNLQVLCRDCNLGKSDRDSTDWRRDG
jgi:5-methylcytosine-specific restriction endonuclease McrA